MFAMSSGTHCLSCSPNTGRYHRDIEGYDLRIARVHCVGVIGRWVIRGYRIRFRLRGRGVGLPVFSSRARAGITVVLLSALTLDWWRPARTLPDYPCWKFWGIPTHGAFPHLSTGKSARPDHAYVLFGPYAIVAEHLRINFHYNQTPPYSRRRP